MSSEQPEVETAPAVTDNTQQATSPTPSVTDITQQATSPDPRPHVKNPKRVAAGKMVAERTRIAREQQKKKASAEASVANKNEKSVASPSEPEPKAESGLTLNQWIGIGGLVVSAAGLFLKREEIMGAVKKNLPSPPPPVEPAPPPPVGPSPQLKVLRKMT